MPPEEKCGGIPKFPPHPLKAAERRGCDPSFGFHPGANAPATFPKPLRQRLAKRTARKEERRPNDNHPNLPPLPTNAAAHRFNCSMGPPPKPSEAGSVGRGDAAERARPARQGGARDVKLVSTRRSRQKAAGLCRNIEPTTPVIAANGLWPFCGTGVFLSARCTALFLWQDQRKRGVHCPHRSGAFSAETAQTPLHPERVHPDFGKNPL